jgi:hypothetical protein
MAGPIGITQIEGGDEPTANMPYEEIIKLLETEYGDIDDIFATNPELQKLLESAFSEKWTAQRFYNAVTTTNWFKQNAEKLQQRGYYKRIYQDLIKGIAEDDPDRKEKIRAAAGNTEYFRGLDSFEARLETLLTERGISYTPEQLSLWAEEIYSNANEADNNFINRFLNRKILFSTQQRPAGAAADNLSILRSYAQDMGMNLERDYASSLTDWLQRLDRGESVQTFKDIIRDQVASTSGEYIGKMIERGLTLKEIYQPYKQLMASTLEISPDEIDLNDQFLRSAITPEGQINLYDWKKRLRQDDRWQYTQAARDDVYGKIYKVLKDFGFTG